MFICVLLLSRREYIKLGYHPYSGYPSFSNQTYHLLIWFYVKARLQLLIQIYSDLNITAYLIFKGNQVQHSLAILIQNFSTTLGLFSSLKDVLGSLQLHLSSNWISWLWFLMVAKVLSLLSFLRLRGLMHSSLSLSLKKISMLVVSKYSSFYCGNDHFTFWLHLLGLFPCFD